MKNYSYNSDFLEEWFNRSGMRITQLMKDLGVNNVSLKRWMQDKTNPMPVEKMVLFCNLYDVDILEFFLSDGVRTTIHPESKIPSSTCADYDIVSDSSYCDNYPSKENMLNMQILHLQEVNRIEKEAMERENKLRADYQQREELLRKEYENKLSEYKDMLRESMHTTRLAISGRNNVGYDNMSFGMSDLPDPKKL